MRGEGNGYYLRSFCTRLKNVLALDTDSYQCMQLTIIPTEPHCELLPRHVIAFGSVGGFLAVGSHVVHGTEGFLGSGDSISLASLMRFAQPTSTVSPRRVVRPDVPRLDND